MSDSANASSDNNNNDVVERQQPSKRKRVATASKRYTITPKKAAAEAKATKKEQKSTTKSPSKKSANHPSYNEMINEAVGSINDKNGTSRVAIYKYIVENYKVGDNVKQVNHFNCGKSSFNLIF